MATRSQLQRRKADHLELCSSDQVEFRGRGTLLEDVQLLHQALPELSCDDIDLGVELLGKELRAPLVIASMTGGTREAAEVNFELSRIAEERGYGFGLGSQRAMQRQPETAWTYKVRAHAPSTLLLGNVGVVQARDTDTGALRELIDATGVDALCVHMNPAMELIQAGGDRDFRGCIDTFARLVHELSVPIVAKETGCGISRQTAHSIRRAGVEQVDVSGAGGTSWIGVETLRAHGQARSVGELLWDWGIPTAATICYAVECGLRVIATGGIRTGLDVARAIALGADAAGMARPVLEALKKHGRQGANRLLDQVERELRTIMLLCGAATLHDLRLAPRLLMGELRQWLAVR